MKIHQQLKVRASEESSDARVLEFVASDRTRDSHKTVLNPQGWHLDRFNKNGIIGYQHEVYGSFFSEDSNPDNVIGKGEARMEGDELIIRIEFEPAELNEKADKIYRKLLFGSLNAVSVGFVPVGEGHYGIGDEARGAINETYYYEGQELLEVSIVNIPSNPNAVKKAFDEMKSAYSRMMRALEDDDTLQENKEIENPTPVAQDEDVVGDEARELIGKAYTLIARGHLD